MIELNQLRLPSVSLEGMKVLDIIGQDEPDYRELAETTLRDTILSLTLIKYANSPLYRRSTPIDSVQGAIRVLGLKNIRSAIMVATMRKFTRGIPANCHLITRHCNDIAFLSSRLGKAATPELADEMAFLGLIHDMGMLVLASNFPDIYSVIMDHSVHDGEIIGDLEECNFGVRHDDIIEQIFKDFRLPEEHIALLASYHREICLPPDDPQLVRRQIIDLAHLLWAERHQNDIFRERSGSLGRDDLIEALGIQGPTIKAIEHEFAELEGL